MLWLAMPSLRPYHVRVRVWGRLEGAWLKTVRYFFLFLFFFYSFIFIYLFIWSPGCKMNYPFPYFLTRGL